MPKLVKAEEASQYYKISISNLRKWARDGRIQVTKTPGGHYMYSIPETTDCTAFPNISDWTPNIIYSRVSSKMHRDELSQQSTFLRTSYPSYTLIEDIGSGIDYERPCFLAILEQLFKGTIKTVVVTHPDRFSRFHFTFFQWLFIQHNAELKSVNKQCFEIQNEITRDLMDIVSIFSSIYQRGIDNDNEKKKEKEEGDGIIVQKSFSE